MNVGREVPPAGDVTFVFTDIEGSTAHLVRLGDEYPVALDDHRSMLRAAWNAHDGYEVGTDGDSFFVAFDDPTAAVAACVEAQRALGSFDWPEGRPIRVRMGAHRGHAIPRSGDYVALAVHRAARIASAASGGQILLSADVAQRCGDLGGPTLTSIGDWRVRDFDEPVELFLVLDSEIGLSSALPRLVPASGHNIVLPNNRFLGRESEIEVLRDAVGAGRLVTVVGPGGVGKTRLVQELGVGLCEGWPDGVWFVPLERVVDGHGVSTAVLSAIGNAGSDGEGWQGALKKLRSMRALIVLDNCEHVADAAAEVIADLLVGSDTLGVVATSRHNLVGTRPLGIDEATLRLEPLGTSSLGDASVARQLFVARAGLLGWEPSAAECAAIDRLCTQVDGLPLAIEIVAAWIEAMSADELCDEFADPERRRMIESGAHRTDDRSVSSVIESSLGRLDPPLREVLSAVSILPSSFSIEVARNTVGDVDGGLHTKLSLFELVTRSLVVSDRSEGSARYRLLQTIRQHLLEQLSPDQRSDFERRASSYYCSTLGPAQSADRRWVAEMGIELENVSALRTARGAKLEHRFDLAWSLGNYRDGTGRFSTGIDELTRFLAGEPEAPPERAAINTLLANLALRVGDIGRAATYLVEAEQLAARVGMPSWDDASIFVMRAALALWRGDIDGCGRIASEGLNSDLSVRGRARIHDVRGIALMQAGDVASASTEFAIEVDLWRELGVDTKLCTALGNLAEAHLQLDELALAAENQRECLRLARELGQDVWIAHSMTMAAQLSARSSQWSRSLALQDAADEEYERIGLRMFASDEAAREELRQKAAVRTEAGAANGGTPPPDKRTDRAAFVELASDVLDELHSR